MCSRHWLAGAAAGSFPGALPSRRAGDHHAPPSDVSLPLGPARGRRRRIAERLAAAGATGVALSASYHSGRFVRPHGPDKIVFPEGNTTYFRPDPRRYRRLVPQQAAMSREFDSFRALADGAPGLSVTAWTIGLTIPASAVSTRSCRPDGLWRSAGELALPVAAGGAPLPSALGADTAAQPGVSEIALEAPGWQAFRHGYHHEFELIELPDPVKVMLGTCFCPACTERARGAGLDLDRLARRTRAELDAFFADGTPPPNRSPDRCRMARACRLARRDGGGACHRGPRGSARRGGAGGDPDGAEPEQPVLDRGVATSPGSAAPPTGWRSPPTSRVLPRSSPMPPRWCGRRGRRAERFNSSPDLAQPDRRGAGGRGGSWAAQSRRQIDLVLQLRPHAPSVARLDRGGPELGGRHARSPPDRRARHWRGARHRPCHSPPARQGGGGRGGARP